MQSPLYAFPDPATEEIDFFLTQGIMFIRHAVFRIADRNPSHEFTAIGVTGNDGGLARFGGRQGLFSEKQTESAFRFYTSMTTDTFLIQQGLDIGIVINRRFLKGHKIYDDAGY